MKAAHCTGGAPEARSGGSRVAGHVLGRPWRMHGRRRPWSRRRPRRSSRSNSATGASALRQRRACPAILGAAERAPKVPGDPQDDNVIPRRPAARRPGSPPHMLPGHRQASQSSASQRRAAPQTSATGRPGPAGTLHARQRSSDARNARRGRGRPPRSAEEVVALGPVEQVGQVVGQGGRTPVARSTASGNLAGWAVAMHTTGRSAASGVAARHCRADPDRGVRVGQVAGAVGTGRRSRPAVASPSRLAATNVGSGRRLDRPDALRNRAISSAVAAPSRPSSSNSRRSWLDDTWMSMLGLSVGTTPVCARSPVRTQRVRMSLLFDPTTSRSMGAHRPAGDPPGEHVAEVAGGHGDVAGDPRRRPPRT